MPRATWLGGMLLLAAATAVAAEPDAVRDYANRLVPIERPEPLLADHPEWCAPLVEERHFEAPSLVVDERGDLAVRAWRFSYNARGIIEIPNTLRAADTAVVVVHPWGIDDGQGWRTPEPAGVADFCTPVKNTLSGRHTREVVRPFVNRLRGLVDCVVYSLPGKRDAIRARCYRSFDHQPDAAERDRGAAELKAALAAFDYRGADLPAALALSARHPVRDYFRQFPGLDAGDRYDPVGFWKLPIPVTADLDVDPADVVAYDDEGYEPLRDFLRARGVRHVLLAGYATDMCYCRTTAGYENLSRDFNVFLVGDATLATFPANRSPREAVTAALALASLNQLVTQISWVRPLAEARR